MSEDIKEELKIIIGILLNQKKVNDWSLGDKIRFLDSLDYDNNEIAKMLNTTYGMVAKEKSKGRNRRQNE